MRSRNTSALLAAFAAGICASVSPAAAKCKTMTFSVNDYGKDGPTRDAKNLLDKYIVDWTKGQGIKSYTVGKKNVSCKLFLNFIVFDEHTCTASAQVCWGDGVQPAAAPEKPITAPPARPPAPKKAQIPG